MFCVALLATLLCGLLAQDAEAVTANVRDAFLSHINQARSHEAVAEHVSNMWKVTWDADLAHKAQNWADQCTWQHSNTGIEVLYSSSTVNAAALAGHVLGENCGIVLGPRLDCATQKCYYYFPDNANLAHYAIEAVDAWMKEKPHNGGHYRVLVKDNHRHVGCGVKKCQHIGSFTTGTYVVCEFKAIGNGADNQLYLHGTPCSHCGANTHCQDHLCVHN